MRLSHVALNEWGRKYRKVEGRTKRARDRRLAIKDSLTGELHTAERRLIEYEAENPLPMPDAGEGEGL